VYKFFSPFRIVWGMGRVVNGLRFTVKKRLNKEIRRRTGSWFYVKNGYDN